MRRLTALTTVVLSFALLAAACGDDGTAADEDGGSTTTTAAADSGDGDPVDDTVPTGDDTTPDVELTASDRGITEDTVRIGLAIPDVTQFSNTGDQVARYRVVADEINRNGGVIGRQIELVVTEWSLTDTTGFDAACVQLTEDEEVFAVVSRTPSGFGDMTCLTDLGDTITVNGLDLDAEQIERSDGKLFSVLSDSYAALYGGVEQLRDELADAKIAVTASNEGGGEGQAAALEALLGDLGLEVVATTLSTVAYSDDPTASLTEQDRFAEIWNSAGATHVIGVGNAVIGAAYAIDNQDLEDEMVLITSNLGVRTLNSLGADLSVLQMIGVAAPDPGSVAEAGLNGMPECIALIEEQLGETVIFFPEEEDLLALSSTWMACASFDFLTAALEAVGPNPTQEDFLALTDAGFSFEMTGAASASVAADKAYMNDDPGTIYDWDGTAFTPRG
jgi:ABC-type branched-subunit amino acid transport system substrate-binding protein